MVSSKLDDVQDHFHHSLFANISQRVAFFKSHMLPVSHSTGKIADHDSNICEVKSLKISSFFYPWTFCDCYGYWNSVINTMIPLFFSFFK
jgi:hypothetical protein